MNYKVEKTEKNELRTTIELSKEEWLSANKKAYEKNKSKYSVPGFRKGHVPYAYMVKTYGEQIFFEDAVNIAFSEHYFDIIDKETDYTVIDGPSVEDIKMPDEGGITIVAVAPLKPEVKLGKYKGIKIEKVEYNVTDADVEKEISNLQERNSREIEVLDRSVQEGDICDIDFSGSVDNVKFEGGTAEHYSLTIGSKTFIPGFEDQIIGMNIGGERDITVKFPEDYGQPNLAGKEAVFAIKLHGIKVKELPEVDDEFIKDATGEETVDAYKASVRAKLQKANDERAKHEIEDKIVKMITDSSEVEVPDCLVERGVDNLVQDMEYRMMYQGLKLADYLKITGQTMEDYRKSLVEPAKTRVKSQLVVEQLIVAENITASDEELDNKIKAQAESVEKTFEEYKAGMPAQQIEYIKNSIIIDKLFEFLVNNNKIS